MAVEADVIVLASVHFMAETAKLLNPDKTSLIPDMQADCSLANSITPVDVRQLRSATQGTDRHVCQHLRRLWAETDVCTSGNAKAIVEALSVPQVIMLPDEQLAQNIAAQIAVKIIAWKGHCEVRERFSPADIRQLREDHPGVTVLVHPECPPEVKRISPARPPPCPTMRDLAEEIDGAGSAMGNISLVEAA
ncbi:quinolinate synthase NadA [Mesorhizobium sp.]|uniref:quinolinate synthase NadA n=1 Tax=Mesorhizobium sp. TaxID=1871066 RepID=UPI0025D072C5|nr:quinolinate synthase NadA [Mesorhizobium sp.]